VDAIETMRQSVHYYHQGGERSFWPSEVLRA